MMNRSLERGLDAGAAPNRSRSLRGPPVCISSMAQQASPKSMYQMLFDAAPVEEPVHRLVRVAIMTLPPSSAYLASGARGAIRDEVFRAPSLGSFSKRRGERPPVSLMGRASACGGRGSA